MNPGVRHQLAKEQSRLVDALVAGGATPEGFDHARLELAARMLLRKRADLLARAWPALVESLGDLFIPLFSDFAKEHPVRSENEINGEGEAFVRFVQRTNALSDSAVLEWLFHRANRRTFGAAVLSESSQLALVLHLPWPRPLLVLIPWFTQKAPLKS